MCHEDDSFVYSTIRTKFTEESVHISSITVVSDSLQSHGLQHSRPPYPSTTPGDYSNHVHWVSDAIQPSNPLLSPSPPTFNLSQHQALLKWVSLSHHVAKVLEFQLQHPKNIPPKNIQDWFPLGCTGWSSLQSKGLLRVLQFKGINSLVLSLLYDPAVTSIHDYWENHTFDQTDLCRQSNISAFYYPV